MEDKQLVKAAHRIIGGIQDHLPLMFWDTGA